MLRLLTSIFRQSDALRPPLTNSIIIIVVLAVSLVVMVVSLYVILSRTGSEEYDWRMDAPAVCGCNWVCWETSSVHCNTILHYNRNVFFVAANQPATNKAIYLCSCRVLSTRLNQRMRRSSSNHHISEWFPRHPPPPQRLRGSILMISSRRVIRLLSGGCPLHCCMWCASSHAIVTAWNDRWREI